MNLNTLNLANKDIRIKCLESGIRFWQIALQLGVSPETITRRLRVELPADEKEVIIRAMEQIMQER